MDCAPLLATAKSAGTDHPRETKNPTFSSVVLIREFSPKRITQTLEKSLYPSVYGRAISITRKKHSCSKTELTGGSCILVTACYLLPTDSPLPKI